MEEMCGGTRWEKAWAATTDWSVVSERYRRIRMINHIDGSLMDVSLNWLPIAAYAGDPIAVALETL